VTTPAPHIGKGRRIAIWTLIIVASLLMFVTTLTLWVNRQLLDNGAWTTTSSQVITDKGVQDALSVFLVNQLYTNVDVPAALQRRLPDNLDPLAVPIAGALRAPAGSAVKFMLARPRVQQLWVTAMSNAHRRLVNVLENKTGNGVTTGNGTVTLDLSALVTSLGTELGLPEAALAKLPPDAGQIVVMKSSSLGAAQKAVQAIHVLSQWLLVLVLVMYAVAAYLAVGERRVTIRRIGWAFVIVGLSVLVLRKLAGDYVVNAITQPSRSGTGHSVWLISTAILGQIGWAAVLYGLVFVFAMMLAGGTAPARAARRAIGPTLIEQPAVGWASAAGLLLLAVLWGGTHALRTVWGVALFAVLIAAGLVALRAQVRAEQLAESQPPSPTDDEFDAANKLALT
jgi:hypothetical protein